MGLIHHAALVAVGAKPAGEAAPGIAVIYGVGGFFPRQLNDFTVHNTGGM